MGKKEDPSLNRQTAKRHPTPGERAARALLSSVGWMKDCLSSFRIKRPGGRIIRHRGRALPAGVAIRFARILIVEDDPQTAQTFMDAIRQFYLYGDILIFLAYGFDTAVSFFENEDIKLVIMDSELNDETGDGMLLTRRFFAERPEIVVLANSSSRISNLRMESHGAADSLGKNRAQLQAWLDEHDGAGTGRF